MSLTTINDFLGLIIKDYECRFTEEGFPLADYITLSFEDCDDKLLISIYQMCCEISFYDIRNLNKVIGKRLISISYSKDGSYDYKEEKTDGYSNKDFVIDENEMLVIYNPESVECKTYRMEFDDGDFVEFTMITLSNGYYSGEIEFSKKIN